jgi:hypothetical protein
MCTTLTNMIGSQTHLSHIISHSIDTPTFRFPRYISNYPAWRQPWSFESLMWRLQRLGVVVLHVNNPTPVVRATFFPRTPAWYSLLDSTSPGKLQSADRIHFFLIWRQSRVLCHLLSSVFANVVMGHSTQGSEIGRGTLMDFFNRQTKLEEHEPCLGLHFYPKVF